MKTSIGRLALLATSLVVMTHVAAAQEPVHAFEDLQIKPRQEVIVRGEDGKTFRGRVVSLSANQLEVERRRWNFRKETRSFNEEAVRTIRRRDSTLDGLLIGAAAGILGGGVLGGTCDGSEVTCFMVAFLSFSGGPLVGETIDGAINRTIFTRPNPSRGVTVAPLVGRDRIGLLARIPLR